MGFLRVLGGLCGLTTTTVPIASYNDGLRRLVAFLVLDTCALTFAQTPPQPQFTDRVEVARVVVDVRALDGMGNAIEGLTTDDFAVKIDGKPARVELQPGG